MNARLTFSLAVLTLGAALLWLRPTAKLESSGSPPTSHPAPLAEKISTTTEPRDALLTSLAAAQNESDPDAQAEAIATLVRQVPAAEISAALARLEGETSPAASELREALIERWTAADPAAAAQWATGLAHGPRREEALKKVARDWAAEDSSGAADWVNSQPDGPLKDSLAIEVAYEAARTNALFALQLIAPLSASAERDAALVHALSQWAAFETTAAAEWIAAVPDAALRQRLTAAFAVALSERDPAAAATIASQSLAPGGAQNRTVVSILQQWAQTAPADAAQWVGRFAAGSLRDDATRSLLSLWTLRDAEATARWVENLSDPAWQTAARSAYQAALSQRAVITAAEAAPGQ